MSLRLCGALDSNDDSMGSALKNKTSIVRSAEVASFLDVLESQILQVDHSGDDGMISAVLSIADEDIKEDTGSSDEANLEAESLAAVYQRLGHLNCLVQRRDDIDAPPSSSFISIDENTTFKVIEVMAKFVARVYIVEHDAVPSDAFMLSVPGDDHVPGTATFFEDVVAVDSEAATVPLWSVGSRSGVITIVSDIDREKNQKKESLDVHVRARVSAFPSTLESTSWANCLPASQESLDALGASVNLLDPLPDKVSLLKCAPTTLLDAGVCIASGAGVGCNPHTLEAAASTLIEAYSNTGATPSCSELERYWSNAERCRGAARINEPFLSQVYQTCRVQGCPQCMGCQRTDIAALLQLQSEAIDRDAVEGCKGLRDLGLQINACYAQRREVFVPGDDGALFGVGLTASTGDNTLAALLNVHCSTGDRPSNDANAVSHERLLASATKLALSDASDVQCKSELSPFLLGLAHLKDVGMLLPHDVVQELVSKCQQLCSPNGFACGPEVEIDFLVHIIVDDINDHTPVFEQDRYVFAVAEEVAFDAGSGGGEIGQVYAMDHDDELAHYSIAGYRGQSCAHSDGGGGRRNAIDAATEGNAADGNCIWQQVEDEEGRKITIDVNTGVLSASKRLDYEEEGSVIELTVRASDADNLHSAECTVAINLADKNDNWPTIVIMSGAANGTVSRREDEGPGELEPLYYAADLDHVDDGQLRYHITSGDAGGVFTINATTGILTCTQFLDFEERSSYRLGIEVVDGAGHASAAASITINVENVDEFGFLGIAEAESFYPLRAFPDTNGNPSQNLTYTVEVPEDVGAGGDVLFKLAAGEDAGSSRFNGLTTFKIDGMDGRQVEALPFTVESTGWVLLNAQLDRENTSSYTFQVAASSTGSREAIAVVHVVVVDANDNAPSFSSPTLRGTINQTSASVGDVVMTLANFVRDADSGENTKLSYEVIPPAADVTKVPERTTLISPPTELPSFGMSGSAVLVDKETGDITIADLSNFAGCDKMTAEVVAQDGGTPPLTSRPVTVIINVVPCEVTAARSPKTAAATVVLVLFFFILVAVVGMAVWRRHKNQGSASISTVLKQHSESMEMTSPNLAVNKAFSTGSAGSMDVQAADGTTFTIPVSPTSWTMFATETTTVSHGTTFAIPVSQT